MAFNNKVMGFEKVMPAHFELARAYFETHPAKNYLSRNNSFWGDRREMLHRVENSFIYDRANNVLYVKEDTHSHRPGVRPGVGGPRDKYYKDKYYSGNGNSALFKLIQTEQGGMDGLKISYPLGDESERLEAKESMRRMGVLHYSFERRSTTEKPFFKKNGNDIKEYEIQELAKGISLRDFILKKNITTLELIEIALDVMKKVHEAHSLGVIHADLKEENMMIYKNLTDNTYEIALIDYGYSFVLKEGQNRIERKVPRGTRVFEAPEIRAASCRSPSPASAAVYSKESDIYALGSMFLGNKEARSVTYGQYYNDQYWFDRMNSLEDYLEDYLEILNLFEQMTAVDPRERPPLSEVIEMVEKCVATAKLDARPEPSSGMFRSSSFRPRW